jgi:aminoglycoside phosphotransferase
MEERGVELAIGKIAGAAKDDEIEWLNLDNACGHNASVWSLRKTRVGTVAQAIKKLTRQTAQSQVRAMCGPFPSQLA